MDDIRHTEPPSETQSATDWGRIVSLSDEDIARAVEGDVDAAPILDAEQLRRDYRPHSARLP